MQFNRQCDLGDIMIMRKTPCSPHWVRTNEENPRQDKVQEMQVTGKVSIFDKL